MKVLARLHSAKLYAIVVLVILLFMAARIVARPLTSTAALRNWIESAAA